MKKRILALALVILTAIAALAFAAGPYFILENRGTMVEPLAPALTLGVDWETTVGDVFTGPSFGGDFSFGFDNILAELNPENTWNVALDLDIDFGAVRGEFASLIVVNPENYPHNLKVTNASSIEAKIVGALDPVEIWGGLNLGYAGGQRWKPILFFGIDVHWDL